jgi:hypothetical protein
MKMKNVLILLSVLLICSTLSVLAQNQDDEDLTADVSFVVLKSFNGKPIHNAAVVVHPVDPHGKQEREGVELKTDEDGKAHFDGVPYGKMRIQVLVSGYQTYGQDYDVNQPTLAITIKMERPKQQYSIYQDDKNNQQQPPDSGAPQKAPQK